MQPTTENHKHNNQPMKWKRKHEIDDDVDNGVSGEQCGKNVLWLLIWQKYE